MQADLIHIINTDQQATLNTMDKDVKFDRSKESKYEEEAGDIMGAMIRKTFPNDYHFLCGCANFDPCGHNEMFRKVARDHFRRKITALSGTHGSGQCKVRAEVSDVIELANTVAEATSGVEGSRFRIWKPNLEPKKRLNESNWEESSFKDITENIGSLKKNLEWPLRRALEDVRKQLQVEAGGPPPSNGLTMTQGGPPPANGLTMTQGGPPPANGLTMTQGGPPPSNGLTMTQGGPPPSNGLTMSQGGAPPSNGLTMSQGGPPPSNGLTMSQTVPTMMTQPAAVTSTVHSVPPMVQPNVPLSMPLTEKNHITQPPVARSSEWPNSVEAPRTVSSSATAISSISHEFAGSTFPHEQLAQFEHQNPKRIKRDLGDPDAVVKVYVHRYNTAEIQDALERMDKDRGSKNLEDWAKEVYTTLQKDPEDKRTKALNKYRKDCLDLLYDMVKEWENFGYSEEFEQAIDCVFKTRRLVRILSFCLPLDRAQSLYKMRHGTTDSIGMPWYSELHLKPGTSYARDHPEEQTEWIKFIGSYSGRGTMNKKMFRLLFSDRLSLRSNEDFRRWSKPTKVPGGNQRV